MPSENDDMIEAYQKFLEVEQTCGAMMEQDQEVPLARNADGDFLKIEIKKEQDSMETQQSHLINFYGMEDALGVSHAPFANGATVSSSAFSGSIWQSPFSTTTTSCGYSTIDSKDSLNTPTPYCPNAVTGLKWDPSLSSNSTYQSPMVSSPLLSSTASPAPSLPLMSSSQSISSSPSSSLLSSSSSSTTPASLQRDSFLQQEVSAPSSFSSLLDSRFDLTPPPSSRSSLSPSSSSSLSASPPSSGSYIGELVFAPAAPVSTTRTRTSITNVFAGSGCTLVSNSSFLEEPPHQALNEDILEYTDLDKQPFSMYEDFDMDGKQQSSITINGDNSNSSSSGHVLDDPQLLAGLHLIHDTLQRDCEQLDIPFDPMLWTPEHVQRWVSELCQKKSVPDVSAQLYPLTGADLFSMPDSAFQQHGESGAHISFEIACYKAANSVMHQETLPQTVMPVYSGTGNDQQPRQQTILASPCVSPAPSNCSNSQGSSTGFSTPSDHSDDEGFYNMPSSEKRKTTGPRSSNGSGNGRGIYLWQFLVELLMSGDPAHSDCIRWIDSQKGIFKIEDSKKVASLWGTRKNRPMMNYDKLSRSVRQYYKKGIIKKTAQSRRLVYQFCEPTLVSIMRTAK